MAAYYNEIEPFAAEWLRNLIARGLIADGTVDTRSIVDVEPYDLRDFDQCHFFAGIGVWSHALRLAGWPDGRQVWTGSCPCQPFSVAGRAHGFADERHLWPHWFHLIRECRPRVVFGEQVASKDGLAWLDLVHADLEGEGYAVGALDQCAAGVGAPHIRQRLYFVAERLADNDARSHGERGRPGERLQARAPGSAQGGAARLMGDADSAGPQARERGALVGAGRWEEGRAVVQPSRPLGRLADDDDDGFAQQRRSGLLDSQRTAQRHDPDGRGEVHRELPGPTNGQWRDADWLGCRDGKWRPVEPGTFPLAHGAPARVGRLRAYGNAIVAPLAAEVIRAFMDARP
ncbi:MAG: DNA cytosine methyltransferase [Opitutia bacterium]